MDVSGRVMPAADLILPLLPTSATNAEPTAMLKSVGRRSPRQILRTRVSQAVPRPTGIARPTRSSSRVQSRLPASSPTAPSLLEPVYVSLSAPFKPKRTDPDPEETLVALDPTVFNHPIRRDILHLCVVQYRDNLRQGSANTKTRGEVRGSGRKIRPQKGTGKARLGDAQSPMLRGGGIAFGPKPRDFSTKLPRKVIQMGMRVALSAKVKEQQFGVMFSMDWPEPKTKTLAKRLEDLGLDQTLFVTGEEEIPVTLERAIRNIPKVKLTTSNTLTVHELLKWRRIMLDAKAVDFFERTLSRTTPTVEH